MKKLLAVFLLLITLTACGSPGPAPEFDRTITDSLGRTVPIPDTVERVVCVGVGALRYTCYLQCAGLVVGVEDYETTLSEIRLYNRVNIAHFQELPTIGGNGTPDAEQILTVDPQVIVMSAYAGADPDELQAKTGIPVVVIPGSDSALDEKCFQTISLLGRLYGREDRAEALTAYLEAIRQDLTSRTASVPDSEKPTVYVAGMSYKGSHGFGGTEAGYGPLAFIGAKNLADTTGQTGFFEIDPEQVLTWDPDVIFLDYDGLPLIREDMEKNPAFYENLTAFRSGRVYAQISFRNYAVNLETALADAYYAATILYPEQFSDIDIEEKTREIFTTLLGADPYNDLKESGYAFQPLALLP